MSSFWLILKQQWTIKISSPLFSIFSLVAILVGSRDHRAQFWKGAIQGPFHQSLVAIGPVVSEENIKMWKLTTYETDGRTDGRTDDGRQVMAKAHMKWNARSKLFYCIIYRSSIWSSRTLTKLKLQSHKCFNEWKYQYSKYKNKNHSGTTRKNYRISIWCQI